MNDNSITNEVVTESNQFISASARNSSLGTHKRVGLHLYSKFYFDLGSKCVQNRGIDENKIKYITAHDAGYYIAMHVNSTLVCLRP